MIKTMMIVLIDSGTEFDSMPEIMKGAIMKAGAEWPERQMIGTKSVNGKSLILLNSGISSSELLEWANGQYPVTRGDTLLGIPGTYEEFNLGWQVMAEEGIPIVQAPILPYMLPDNTYDENGNITGSVPVTDLTGRLQTWAGRKWVY